MNAALPLPVASSSATVCPGSALKLTSFTRGRPAEVAESDVLDRHATLHGRQGSASGLSVTSFGVSLISKMRCADAPACDICDDENEHTEREKRRPDTG